jgi:NADH-quinone oxidoreductase subunit L
MIFSGALSVLGIAAAYVMYLRQPWLAGLAKASAGNAHTTLWNKYYVDELYDRALVEPSKKTGRFCVGVDDYLIDGLIWLVTAVPRAFGLILRGMHGGAIQSYGLSMVAGLTIIVLLVFWS